MLGLMAQIVMSLKLDEAQFYFAVTLILLIGIFGWFQVFKE